MAEFCVDCWNELNQTRADPEEYVLSWGVELCEGCGQLKHVVIRRRKSFLIMTILYLLRIIRTGIGKNRRP